MKIHTNVMYVRESSSTVPVSRHIMSFTVEIKPSHALTQTVTNITNGRLSYRGTLRCTQERNHSSVLSARKHLQDLIAVGLMPIAAHVKRIMTFKDPFDHSLALILNLPRL